MKVFISIQFSSADYGRVEYFKVFGLVLVRYYLLYF